MLWKINVCFLVAMSCAAVKNNSKKTKQSPYCLNVNGKSNYTKLIPQLCLPINFYEESNTITNATNMYLSIFLFILSNKQEKFT